jgi:LacI family transcriptional regulator
LQTITIKDIAKALNLSTSTVSRALRDSYEINPETKRLVLEYATKMNYSPNPIALSLKGSNSKAIGVIVPEIANNYFSQAINGIEEVAYKRGYHVVIFQSLESYTREVASVGQLMARKVDGLLISLSGGTTQYEHLQELLNRKFPVVLFDRVADELDTFKVVVDNFEGAFKATEHLILSGRKNIAHLTGSPFVSVTQERIAGYRAALEKYNLPYREDFIKYCGYVLEEVDIVVDNLMKGSPRPDAFFTTSDRIALFCFAALKKHNFQIPQQVSVIGFTNLTVADLLDPPLSTIFQPAFDIGQTSAGLLLDLIETKNKSLSYKTIKLQTNLFIRKSSVI